MTEYKQSSGFKYVFWGIFFLFFLAFMGQVAWILLGGFRSFPYWFGINYHESYMIGQHSGWLRMLMMAAPTCVIFLAWVGIAGTMVYNDAKKRGMDPYLWATVAVFLPFFLGIIIYLVVRSNGRSTCEKCGELIRSEYKVCPHCGHRREHLCPGCGKSIAPEWKVCPHCEYKLATSP
jgi:RNA polymerase subunit RPABC4/transcription elongation factor Spt4